MPLTFKMSDSSKQKSTIKNKTTPIKIFFQFHTLGNVFLRYTNAVKVFKKILLSLGLLFILAVSGIAALAFFYGDKLKDKAVSELNQVLNSPVKVGAIGLRTFKNFPNLTLVIQQISFEESYPVQQKSLAWCESAEITFGVWNLFSKTFRIRKITLNNLKVDAAKDKKGNKNYEIFKPAANNKATQSFDFNALELINANIRFQDDSSKLAAKLFTELWVLSGQFSNDLFQLKSKGKVSIGFIKNGQDYVKDKNIVLNTNLTVNHITQTLRFRSSEIVLEGIPLLLNGEYALQAHGESKLNINLKNGALAALLDLPYVRDQTNLKNLKTEGKLDFNLVLKKSKRMSLAGTFSMQDASVAEKDMGNLAENISLQGNLNISEKQQLLSIKTFSLTMADENLNGKFKLSNFSKPNIEGAIKGKIELARLQSFMPDAVSELSGILALNLNCQFDYDNFINKQVVRGDEIKGNISGKNIHLSQGKLNFTETNFDVASLADKLIIKQFSTKLDSVEYEAKGEIEQLWAYLLSDKTLRCAIDLTVPKLNLKTYQEQTQNEAASIQNSVAFALPPRVAAKLNLNIGTISTLQGEAKRVHAVVKMHKPNIIFEQFSIAALSGVLSGGLKMTEMENKSWLISAEGNLKQIELAEFMLAANHFNQDIFKTATIEGKASIFFKFHALADSLFRFDENKLYLFAQTQLNKGKLENFEPIMQMGRFLKSKNFEKIDFETVLSEIEVGDGMIFISDTEIRTNVLNLKLAGQQTFKGAIQYEAQLFLSELLKRQNSHLAAEGEILPDGIKIFLRAKGTTNKPIFTYHLKKAKEAVKEQLIADKKKIREQIKQDLGIKEKTESENQEPNWEDDLPD